MLFVKKINALVFPHTLGLWEPPDPRDTHAPCSRLARTRRLCLIAASARSGWECAGQRYNSALPA